MEFLKYQHVERLGTTEVEGIEDGLCYVFPKIDGTNASLWWDKGLQAGSRQRQLALDSDNAGFYAWATKQEVFDRWKLFFMQFPNVRLYGEWLVPHTLKTYDATAWRNFYVFDVMVGDNYIGYDTYKTWLDGYGIEYIPAICKIENPTHERLTSLLDSNTYLVADGMGTGEGIVIKNYSFVNKYGRTTWAKIVKNEFKAKHSKNETREVKEVTHTEQKIVSKYITLSLIEKELAKIENELGWSSKFIPRLINTVYYCLIIEESWNFVKEFKNPVIDFSRLFKLTTARIKELMPNLF